MILNRAQGDLLFQPIQADDNHLALLQVAPLFFANYPFVPWRAPEYKRNYTLDTDYQTFKAANPPLDKRLLEEPKPANAAAIPTFAWGGELDRRQARWLMKQQIMPYLQEPNEQDFSQYENNALTQLRIKMQVLAEKLLTDIIRNGPPVALSNSVASLGANLAGYTSANPSVNEGYFDAGATVAQQVMANADPGGNIFRMQMVAGTLTTALTTQLDILLDLVKPNPTCLLVPMRMIIAYKQTFIDRGMVVPTINIDVSRLPANIGLTGGTTAVAYNGVPMIPIKDSIYTAAGHSVTGPMWAAAGAGYSIYAIHANASDPFAGCHIGFLGPALADDWSTVPANGVNLNMGTGIQLIKNGYLSDTTGVKMVLQRILSAKWVNMVGQPQACAIMTGVKD